jgi:predicted enzyme related to lactoylglutathione lyase
MAMTLRWYSTVVESTDHKKLASWWGEALGWQVIFETDEESVLVPPWALELSEKLDFHQVPPGMVFVPVEHEKVGKNRLHWDFAPHTSDDRDAEIARLVELGATVIDVGQPADATWTVLTDPDGNEFCVLSARDQ